MGLRPLKLRFRRQLRKSQHQVEGFGQQAEEQLEKNFFRRLGRLSLIWRFITTWILLWVLLIGLLVVQLEALSGHFQTLQPVPGGLYNEGIVGTYTNASPLYAASDVDTAVSRLIFAGLLKYDDSNRLTGDLAQSWSVDKSDTLYTVKLRPHLTWQDGRSLTAEDVVFTFQTIQDPDAQSPLNASWKGITLAAPDPQTVTFKLPNPLSSFPYSLTTGIVPKHLLANVPAADLRSNDFNTVRPVGAGPFAWHAVQVEQADPATAEAQIQLVPFAHYYAGEPKLASFVVHAYASEDTMLKAFTAHQLTAIADPQTASAKLLSNSALHQYAMRYSAAKMVFFNTSEGVLSDKTVRQALTEAADPAAIIRQLGYNTISVHEPLLQGQIGYDKKYAQTVGNLSAAKQLLDKAGWKAGTDGVLVRKGQPLSFALTVADTPENTMVASMLVQQWQVLGAKVTVDRQAAADFNDTLASRSYDALLYAISIGPDPDVFVYWDSSQIHSAAGLNFSQYDSSAADTALEGGRTRLDPKLRAVKYRPFLQAWQSDNPALALYQPRFLYLSWQPIYGLHESTVNSAADRFGNVQNWEIREAKVTD